MKIDISLHPQICRVVKYAKKAKCLYFSPQAEELQLPDTNNHISYRAGFSSEDITGFWEPKSVIDYVMGNISGFKDGLEFGFLKAFNFLSLKTPWSGWVWVLDSVDTIKHDVVMGKIRATKSRRLKDEMYKKYDELVSLVTEEEVNKEISEHFINLKPHMWVSKSDPSVILYDQKNKPFAMEHGWSKEQVGEILTEWMEEVAGVNVPYQFVEGASW